MSERDVIEAAWRAVTSSVARRDPAAAAAAVPAAVRVGLLQAAGEAALIALQLPSTDVDTEALIAALRARGWDGDDVLVALLTSVATTTSTGRAELRVDLDMLGDVLGDANGGYLDLATGTAWPFEIVEDGQVEGLDPHEDPDPALWLEVPGTGSHEAYRDMVDFATDIIDPPVKGDLMAALDGRGAFRRFQSALDRHERYRVHWRVFSAERTSGRARAWLAQEGYDALP